MIGSHFQSFLFSQVFGLYFVIVSIAMISRADYYKEMITQLKAPGLGVMMVASVSLFVSLFLVVLHNIWVFQPRVIVTVICWVFVIKSVLWLAAPVRMLNMLKGIWTGRKHYVACTFMFVLGIFMMARGFYLFMMDAGALPMGVLS
ncbi:MAG: hypothetical protein P1U61_05850 [Legionellaceae bacterium]|nr:hypothetical protein [Legionellaceae bacterium]